MAGLLALLTDRELAMRLDEIPVVRSGIGGSSALLQVEDTTVFVKQVPLTELERRPENVMSTANLFELPTFYEYGAGSAGFGAWRELAAQAMTTDWVIDRHCESFPLMYHWRVIEGPPREAEATEVYVDLEDMVEYWDGSTAVRGRLEAIAQASASLVLFLEYFPQNLHDWLISQRTEGDFAAEAALAMVERSLTSDVRFMTTNGLFHFDAHFRNILTDGRHLYITDFGLASSWQFQLSESEKRFVAANRYHDVCYAVTQLVNALVIEASGARERNLLIRRWADGEEVEHVWAPAATLVARYAPIAVVMNDFYWKLHGDSRRTAFPVDTIERVCATYGPGWASVGADSTRSDQSEVVVEPTSRPGASTRPPANRGYEVSPRD